MSVSDERDTSSQDHPESPAISVPDDNSAFLASDLCQQCGLCCNGTLFSHVTLKPEDRSDVQQAKLSIIRDSKEREIFDQPCPALKDHCCSVYNLRPKACRSYLCILNREVLNGSSDFAGALAIVRTVQADKNWLESHAPALPEKRRKAPKQDRSILAAWLKPAPEAKAATPLTTLLASLLILFENRLEKARLGEADITYILRAFAHLKTIDRHFEKTRLLPLYANLVQRLRPLESK